MTSAVGMVGRRNAGAVRRRVRGRRRGRRRRRWRRGRRRSGRSGTTCSTGGARSATALLPLLQRAGAGIDRLKATAADGGRREEGAPLKKLGRAAAAAATALAPLAAARVVQWACRPRPARRRPAQVLRSRCRPDRCAEGGRQGGAAGVALVGAVGDDPQAYFAADPTPVSRANVAQAVLFDADCSHGNHAGMKICSILQARQHHAEDGEGAHAVAGAGGPWTVMTTRAYALGHLPAAANRWIEVRNKKLDVLISNLPGSESSTPDCADLHVVREYVTWAPNNRLLPRHQRHAVPRLLLGGAAVLRRGDLPQDAQRGHACDALPHRPPHDALRRARWGRARHAPRRPSPRVRRSRRPSRTAALTSSDRRRELLSFVMIHSSWRRHRHERRAAGCREVPCVATHVFFVRSFWSCGVPSCSSYSCRHGIPLVS